MLFWGVFLVALGIGSLLGVPFWPVVLIGVGTAWILSAGLGRSNSSAWLMPPCCFPSFWTRRATENNGTERDIAKEQT